MTYQPGKLLDTIMAKMSLRTDSALARVLGVEPCVISKVRNDRMPIGASLLITMHDVTGMTTGDMREMMWLSRRMFIKG